jgi:threonine aldolase
MPVDLRSDTLTKPGDGMRAAMAAAEVGDDVYGEDPTVIELESRVAALLGKEAAIFVTSGTQANLIAYMAQTRPGDTVILSEGSHTVHYEGGNIAAFAGLLTKTIVDPLCKIDAARVAQQIMQIDDPHFSPTTLVAIENTTNRGGGTFYTAAEVADLGSLCKTRGLKFHCDGARLFNATLAAGVAPADLCAHFDSVCFCLSKGLGCPAGSLLAGTRDFVHRARRHRKALGGGLRQAGILAAAGLYALDHGHIEDLAEDHRRAAEFRAALEAHGFRFPQPNPTNIVYVQVGGHPIASVGALAGEGVFSLPHDADQVRVVFHRDVDDAGLAQAIDAFKRVVPVA